MEIGSSAGFMNLISAALTPDQSCPSEVWTVDDGTDWVGSEPRGAGAAAVAHIGSSGQSALRILRVELLGFGGFLAA
jgi:hypothetical protein